MKIKQFFYSPAGGDNGDYRTIPFDCWMLECERNRRVKNYKHSAEYKWFKDNCGGGCDIESYMPFGEDEGKLYVTMYRQEDAALVSLTFGVPLPSKFQFEDI